jgi:hypothetical protein
MKKTIGVLGVCLVSLLFMAGCTQQVAHRSYTNTTYGFSLTPPGGWVGVENESVDFAVRFSPQNSSNVSLVVGVPFSLGEGRALSTFADQVEENLSVSGENYSVVYRQARPIPGVQAYEIAYTFEKDGAVIRAKQVAILRTRAVFLLTFTAPNELYFSYLSTVDQSIDTFI